MSDFQSLLEEKMFESSHNHLGASATWKKISEFSFEGLIFDRPSINSLAQPKNKVPYEGLSPQARTLSPAEEEAIAYFASHDIRLNSHYKRHDVVRAFRTLALKLHPDQQKTQDGSEFIRLQKYKKILLEFWDVKKTKVYK